MSEEAKNKIIEKLLEKREKKKKAKKETKESFDILTAKLAESRKHHEMLANEQLDDVISNINTHLAREVENLMLEINETNKKVEKLESQFSNLEKRATDNFESTQHFTEELKQQLHVQTLEEINQKIDELKEKQQKLNAQRQQIIGGEENDLTDVELKQIELIHHAKDNIRNTAEMLQNSDKELSQYLSTLFNIYHRIEEDPKNRFLKTHVTSAKIQAQNFRLYDRSKAGDDIYGVDELEGARV